MRESVSNQKQIFSGREATGKESNQTEQRGEDARQ